MSRCVNVVDPKQPAEFLALAWDLELAAVAVERRGGAEQRPSTDVFQAHLGEPGVRHDARPHLEPPLLIGHSRLSTFAHLGEPDRLRMEREGGDPYRPIPNPGHHP